MYYIVEKTKETGLRFADIIKKKDVAFDETVEASKKHGFNQWRSAHWTVFGGVSSCFFENEPDTKIWKKNGGKGEYMPKRNTKVGKAISKELNELTAVSIKDLNMCIGFDGAPFKTIGFASNNKDYFGFVVDEEWNVKVPEDCKEVLTSEYREIFKTTKD
jgi:hypothetical protein|tara:strand:- start:49 stop:528 length:480 start_codon:yes stop_codon:yes gene_type:complete